MNMTLVQEAAQIMEKMPIKNQRIVVDLLRMMSAGITPVDAGSMVNGPFKRTGKSKFNLPADFDEHFDDLNDEVAALFYGESL